jgi:hypothetical protein
MKLSPRHVQIGLVLLVVVVYVGVLLRNLQESQRRSLYLEERAMAADQVLVSVRVLAVDPNAAEMTARLSFRLAGAIAQDEITPAAELRFFLNNFNGPQEFHFPRNRRMDPLVAVFSLEGNINRYPFDRHQALMHMLVVTPSSAPAVPAKPASKTRKKKNEQVIGGLMLGSALRGNKPVPIALDLNASIPGIKFEGSALSTPGQGVNRVELHLRRADNVILVSIITMVLMMCLAMSVLLMAGRAIASGRELDVLPLTLSVTLLFGLPALRDSQPGVPPLGAFGDYVSFIWAETIVGISAVISIWASLLRSRRPATTERSKNTAAGKS